MNWWDKFLEWGFQQEANKQFTETQKIIDDVNAIGGERQPQKKVVDMMADDTDPEEITIENAYKTRWIWYHTILAIGIFFTNIILFGIFILLAIKL